MRFETLQAFIADLQGQLKESFIKLVSHISRRKALLAMTEHLLQVSPQNVAAQSVTPQLRALIAGSESDEHTWSDLISKCHSDGIGNPTGGKHGTARP
jgi:hypothetical protein